MSTFLLLCISAFMLKIKERNTCVIQRACYTKFQMAIIESTLPYVQVVLSFLLVGAILLQQTGASLGSAFGGDNFSAGVHTRRGSEKVLFNATIVLGVIFVLVTMVALIV